MVRFGYILVAFSVVCALAEPPNQGTEFRFRWPYQHYLIPNTLRLNYAEAKEDMDRAWTRYRNSENALEKKAILGKVQWLLHDMMKRFEGTLENRPEEDWAETEYADVLQDIQTWSREIIGRPEMFDFLIKAAWEKGKNAGPSYPLANEPERPIDHGTKSNRNNALELLSRMGNRPVDHSRIAALLLNPQLGGESERYQYLGRLSRDNPGFYGKAMQGEFLKRKEFLRRFDKEAPSWQSHETAKAFIHETFQPLPFTQPDWILPELIKIAGSTEFSPDVRHVAIQELSYQLPKQSEKDRAAALFFLINLGTKGEDSYGHAAIEALPPLTENEFSQYEKQIFSSSFLNRASQNRTLFPRWFERVADWSPEGRKNLRTKLEAFYRAHPTGKGLSAFSVLFSPALSTEAQVFAEALAMLDRRDRGGFLTVLEAMKSWPNSPSSFKNYSRLWPEAAKVFGSDALSEIINRFLDLLQSPRSLNDKRELARFVQNISELTQQAQTFDDHGLIGRIFKLRPRQAPRLPELPKGSVLSRLRDLKSHKGLDFNDWRLMHGMLRSLSLEGAKKWLETSPLSAYLAEWSQDYLASLEPVTSTNLPWGEELKLLQQDEDGLSALYQEVKKSPWTQYEEKSGWRWQLNVTDVCQGVPVIELKSSMTPGSVRLSAGPKAWTVKNGKTLFSLEYNSQTLTADNGQPLELRKWYPIHGKYPSTPTDPCEEMAGKTNGRVAKVTREKFLRACIAFHTTHLPLPIRYQYWTQLRVQADLMPPSAELDLALARFWYSILKSDQTPVFFQGALEEIAQFPESLNFEDYPDMIAQWQRVFSPRNATGCHPEIERQLAEEMAAIERAKNAPEPRAKVPPSHGGAP